MCELFGGFVGEYDPDVRDPGLTLTFQPELDELGHRGPALRPHQFQMPGIARILVKGRRQ